jgi:hypothetical protein
MDCQPVPTITLRLALAADLALFRRINHKTMRWIVEALFGWDEAEQTRNLHSIQTMSSVANPADRTAARCRVRSRKFA